MASALDEIKDRCECIIYDGGRDVESIIREAYNLEVYDWITWELLEAVCNPSDLLTEELEEELIQYVIGELEDEVQDLVNDKQREDDLKELLEEFGIDYDKTLGNRERYVVDNLDRVEFKLDGGHHVYVFYHKDGEHDFQWDNDSQKITG